jgi:hypothetical protein
MKEISEEQNNGYRYVDTSHHFSANRDLDFHFNAVPVPTLHFNADPDSDPASHQSYANL